MKTNNITKFIEVEIGITHEDYEILKSISYVETYNTISSLIDSLKADEVVKNLIDLIVRSIEYTGKKVT